MSRIDCQVVFGSFKHQHTDFIFQITNLTIPESLLLISLICCGIEVLPPIEQTDGDIHEKMLELRREPGICRCVCVCVSSLPTHSAMYLLRDTLPAALNHMKCSLGVASEKPLQISIQFAKKKSIFADDPLLYMSGASLLARSFAVFFGFLKFSQLMWVGLLLKDCFTNILSCVNSGRSFRFRFALKSFNAVSITI